MTTTTTTYRHVVAKTGYEDPFVPVNTDKLLKAQHKPSPEAEPSCERKYE